MTLPPLPGPPLTLEQGHYRLEFARSSRDIDAALRLRFEVFNRELGEGLEESWKTGLDRDRFDEVCHHLTVRDTESDRVIGTYRMQTGEMAAQGEGFYSDGEFHLEDLGDEVLGNAVEVGRACIAQDHRNRQVLFLLWRGLASYMVAFGKRFLFGCCSLTSQDQAVGLALRGQLEQRNLSWGCWVVRPRSEWRCEASAGEVAAVGVVEVPTLFATYLRYGAKICGAPAIDRQFKTLDFLVLLDTAGLDPRTRELFF